MESQARQILNNANQAREEGDFIKSLALLDQVLIKAQEAGDLITFAETEASRSLTYCHFHQKTHDLMFLILAKHASMAGLEIARKVDDKKAMVIPLYNLAKVYEDLGEFSEAVSAYKETVELMRQFPPDIHDRPSVLADMKMHLAIAEYKNGDKVALDRVVESLVELEQNPDISTYNQDVWVSGGYMKLAEILKDDNPSKAQEYLQKAKTIIDNNPKLTLRHQQWKKLAQNLS